MKLGVGAKIDTELESGEDGGVPTLIEFDFPRESLQVSETQEEVEDAIGAAEPADVPLVKLTNRGGQPVTVNAKHIVQIANK